MSMSCRTDQLDRTDIHGCAAAAGQQIL